MSAADVASARAMGCVVKLLAICERVDLPDVITAKGTAAEGVSVRVHPAMIPLTHPLAGVREAFNAVFVEADAAGQLMFYGKGAGGDPTASAVLGDLVAVARHRVVGGRGPGESSYADLPVLPMGQAITRYHISLDVADRPGVLAQVAGASPSTGCRSRPFASNCCRARVARPGRARRGHPLGPDAALSATVEALAGLDVVESVVSVMRVEGE